MEMVVEIASSLPHLPDAAQIVTATWTNYLAGASYLFRFLSDAYEHEP